MFADGVAQSLDHRILDAVPDSGSFFTAIEHAAARKNRQVFGNVGLTLPGRFDDIRDCDGTWHQRSQNLQPRLIAHRPKGPGHVCDHAVIG